HPGLVAELPLPPQELSFRFGELVAVAFEEAAGESVLELLPGVVGDDAYVEDGPAGDLPAFGGVDAGGPVLAVGDAGEPPGVGVCVEGSCPVDGPDADVGVVSGCEVCVVAGGLGAGPAFVEGHGIRGP